MGASAPSAPRWCTLASRARCDGESLNAVSFIPSGPKMLSWKYRSSFWPLAASTILPAQSMLIPYSQRSPGSKSRGVVNAAFVQVMMPGVPVAS